VTHAARALEPDIPVLWMENGSNVAVFWESRPRAEVDRILAASPRRVRLELVNNRVIPSPMEPRAAVASYDRERDRVTLYTPSQGGPRFHTRLRQFLDGARECVRVLSLDAGGGFGIRSSTYREQLAIAWAARETGLTIRWRGDRSETFVSDYHGRDQINCADMGLDVDGRVTALCVETILNLGAFLTENGPRLPMAGGGRIIPGLYDIADFYLSVAAVFTNTVPTETYRGAGRPEANFLMERLMDTAADACGMSREEVRRCNFIPARKLPYTTPLGLTTDSGDFHGTLQQALGAADWEGFESRRSAARSRGRLRGIGFGMFIAGAGGPPTEEIRLRVAPDGRVTLFPGTYSHGAGARNRVRPAGVPLSGCAIRVSRSRSGRYRHHA
jgi:carbon-monoxide dehydrogenase large subunit